MLAIDLVSTIIQPVKMADTLQSAFQKMQELQVDHLPIVSENELEGLLSAADIAGSDDLTQTLGSIRIPLLLSFVYDHQHFFDVLTMMADQKLTLVPVIDHQKNYLGSVTQTELVEYCNRITSAGQPGGVIILEMNERELSMSEIAKIAESNNARILSYFTETSADSSQVLLTLKLNKTDISAILATFERFNYVIKLSFQPDNFKDDTQGRYESFMNYLNM